MIFCDYPVKKMPRQHVLLSGHMSFYGLACIAAAIFSCAQWLCRMYLLQSRLVVLLKISQLYHFVYCNRQSVDVFSACSCEVRLSAAAALYQLGSFAHHLSGVESVFLHEVFAYHDAEGGASVKVLPTTQSMRSGSAARILNTRSLAASCFIISVEAMTFTPFTMRA